MSKAQIQVQDTSGNWRTVETTISNDQVVQSNLENLSKHYKKTVRAIDGNGILLNIIPYVQGM